MLSCTLTIEYMRVLARFVFRYGVLCLDACFLVLGAFLRLLVAFDAAAGLPDAIGADLVRVFRSAGLFLFPVPVADPLRGSGSIALHCIIVLVACSNILRFKRIRLLCIHFRVYAFKMDSRRVLCGCAAFRVVPVPVLRVLVGLRSIICRFKAIIAH